MEVDRATWLTTQKQELENRRMAELERDRILKEISERKSRQSSRVTSPKHGERSLSDVGIQPMTVISSNQPTSLISSNQQSKSQLVASVPPIHPIGPTTPVTRSQSYPQPISQVPSYHPTPQRSRAISQAPSQHTSPRIPSDIPVVGSLQPNETILYTPDGYVSCVMSDVTFVFMVSYPII